MFFGIYDSQSRQSGVDSPQQNRIYMIEDSRGKESNVVGDNDANLVVKISFDALRLTTTRSHRDFNLIFGDRVSASMLNTRSAAKSLRVKRKVGRNIHGSSFTPAGRSVLRHYQIKL
jgi:hypothetical protein